MPPTQEALRPCGRRARPQGRGGSRHSCPRGVGRRSFLKGGQGSFVLNREGQIYSLGPSGVAARERVPALAGPRRACAENRCPGGQNALSADSGNMCASRLLVTEQPKAPARESRKGPVRWAAGQASPGDGGQEGGDSGRDRAFVWLHLLFRMRKLQGRASGQEEAAGALRRPVYLPLQGPGRPAPPALTGECGGLGVLGGHPGVTARVPKVARLTLSRRFFLSPPRPRTWGLTPTDHQSKSLGRPQRASWYLISQDPNPQDCRDRGSNLCLERAPGVSSRARPRR